MISEDGRPGIGARAPSFRKEYSTIGVIGLTRLYD